MIIRSHAPLRLGLAGGASDVSPFCDQFGGFVLNATIDMFAHCHLEPMDNGAVEFVSLDRGYRVKLEPAAFFPLEGDLVLHRAVYNRIVNEFNGGCPLSIRVTTHLEAPVGSGLGSSSTLVVAMVQAYVEWLKLPLGEYDVAHLAFQIERQDAKMMGGRQDQYAAAFGGVNFMEFYAGNRVIVNPLRIKPTIIRELEASLILYYTGVSRESAHVIRDQTKRVEELDEVAIAATLELKNDAVMMKEALLKAHMKEIAQVLGRSWEAKKKIADSISNPAIEKAYAMAMNAGAVAGRISGAGGGGFIIFMADPIRKFEVIRALEEAGGTVFRFHFCPDGAHAWSAG
jgi:D-glycero-alpha-D-manno-heptose-7-phosphate kinase